VKSRLLKGIVRSAFDVVANVARSNPTIESLTLLTYEEGTNWRDVARAGEGSSLAILLKGLSQDRGRRILTRIPRGEASQENLSNLAQSIGAGRLLGICSTVELVGGGSAHIPMMDFMCDPSTRNAEALTHLIEGLHQGRGCLLESGRSYHYYGFKLLTEEAWKVFLGKCLLMSGFADDRYIGHQLVDGYCVLRLSAGKSKSHVPTVVAELP
jgi:hypothetical protein